jgi:hypothetical protein
VQIRSVRAPKNRAYQVNCNPDCNAACCSKVSSRRVHAVMSPQMVLNLMGIAADDLDHSEGAELGNADSIPRSSRAPSPPPTPGTGAAGLLLGVSVRRSGRPVTD